MNVLNLKKTTIPPRKAQALRDACSNFPKLNTALQDAELFDLETVVQALALELRERKRPATINRLSGRVKALLGVQIDREIAAGA
jgi:hypothetical protein